MQESCTIVTQPAIEPISVAEARRHLRLDFSDGEPAAPPPVGVLAGAGAGALSAGAYRYCVTFVTADGETEAGGQSAPVTVTNPALDGKISISIATGGQAVTSRRIYRTAANGSALLLCAVVANNATTSITDNLADGALGAAVPVTNTTEDPELRRLIRAARAACENECKAAFIETVFDWKFNKNDECGAYKPFDSLQFPKHPVTEIISMIGRNVNGSSFVIDSPEYETLVTDSGSFIRPLLGKAWPATGSYYDSFKICFKAGYGTTAEAVPDPIRHAILFTLGDLYQHRETVVVGNNFSQLPIGAKTLLNPYRRWSF
jgi:uncharacterized phiE125 gp8 family phage protein